VEDFADVRQRLEGYPIVLPERLTFYGMREIGVSEPSLDFHATPLRG
jgi:hypothetical protein